MGKKSMGPGGGAAEEWRREGKLKPRSRFADRSLAPWVSRVWPTQRKSQRKRKSPRVRGHYRQNHGAPPVQFLNRLARLRAFLLRLNYKVESRLKFMVDHAVPV